MILVGAIIMKRFTGNGDRFLRWTKVWARNNVLLLKHICAVDFKVQGEENIVDNDYIAVSKHQSTWECYFIYGFLPNYPVSISKREISFLPIFGIALKNIGTLEIDRDDGIGSIKRIMEGSREFVKSGRRAFMIFPQGTRVLPMSSAKDYPYRAGFIGIARTNKLAIVPIALDSGKFWPKGKFIKEPGTITVKIMPAIDYERHRDMDKNELLSLVENTIEKAQEGIS
jgi:1-acyl-sn-glycerol-3-phosphate acyltransferase